jgi:hypothetical protein
MTKAHHSGAFVIPVNSGGYSSFEPAALTRDKLDRRVVGRIEARCLVSIGEQRGASDQPYQCPNDKCQNPHMLPFLQKILLGESANSIGNMLCVDSGAASSSWGVPDVGMPCTARWTNLRATGVPLAM